MNIYTVFFSHIPTHKKNINPSILSLFLSLSLPIIFNHPHTHSLSLLYFLSLAYTILERTVKDIETVCGQTK